MCLGPLRYWQIATEARPIRAFRAFRLSPTGRLLPVSRGISARWYRPGQTYHDGSCGPTKSWAGPRDLRRGFYALMSPAAVRAVYLDRRRPPPLTVWGTVHLWGHVARHWPGFRKGRAGYRAEYMKIVEIHHEPAVTRRSA